MRYYRNNSSQTCLWDVIIQLCSISDSSTSIEMVLFDTTIGSKATEATGTDEQAAWSLSQLTCQESEDCTRANSLYQYWNTSMNCKNSSPLLMCMALSFSCLNQHTMILQPSQQRWSSPWQAYNHSISSNSFGFHAMTTKLSKILIKNKDTTITLTLPPLLQVALKVSYLLQSWATTALLLMSL